MPRSCKRSHTTPMSETVGNTPVSNTAPVTVQPVQTPPQAPAPPPGGERRMSVLEATEALFAERSAERAPSERTPRLPTQASGTKPDDEAEPPAADTLDEGTDSDDKADDPGAAEPEAEDQAQRADTAEEDPEYEVKIGDTTERVRLSELQKGYLRQKDYTQKRQADAEVQRVYESELAEVRRERSSYVEMLRNLDAQLNAAEESVDWKSVNNFEDWKLAKLAQEQRQAKQAAIKAEQQRVQQEEQKNLTYLLHQAQTEARNVLLQKVPAWQQPEVFQRDVQAMGEVATRVYGFQPQELSSVYDPRL